MAEDVKDSVDDLDLSDFNFDDLPETDVDIDLNLDETNSADLNFDDILAKENKTSADKITEHQGSNLSFDDLGSGGIFEKDNEEISWDAPVAEDVPTVTEKEPEVSPFGVDVDGESAVAEDFTPEPFGAGASEVAEENILAEDVPTVAEKEPEVSPFGADVDGESAVAEDFTPEPFEAGASEVAEENILAENISADEDKNDIPAEEADGDLYDGNEKGGNDYSSLDDLDTESPILETNNIANLRWFSGNENDEMYEIGKNFKSNTFEANDNCKTIHVNVGYDTYGWEVQFADGVIMNLRDVREYQIKNGKLPSPEGRIIYGPNTLMFSGVERIVIFETVRYFSYGV